MDKDLRSNKLFLFPQLQSHSKITQGFYDVCECDKIWIELFFIREQLIQ